MLQQNVLVFFSNYTYFVSNLKFCFNTNQKNYFPKDKNICIYYILYLYSYNIFYITYYIYIAKQKQKTK